MHCVTELHHYILEETAAEEPASEAEGTSAPEGTAEGTPAPEGTAEGTPAPEVVAEGTPEPEVVAEGTPEPEAEAEATGEGAAEEYYIITSEAEYLACKLTDWLLTSNSPGNKGLCGKSCNLYGISNTIVEWL